MELDQGAFDSNSETSTELSQADAAEPMPRSGCVLKTFPTRRGSGAFDRRAKLFLDMQTRKVNSKALSGVYRVLRWQNRFPC